MPTYTHTAEDVINAVIQDGKSMTTNRTALLDYVDRTSFRILRESQWTFLQSAQRRFITQMGIDKYWYNTGNAPAGVANTGLALSNIESILPNSVFDLTNGVELTQTPAQPRYTEYFLQKDGLIRPGQPRGYAQYINEPGIIHVFPPPDNTNNYLPVPAPSVCSSVSGGVLPGLTYNIQTTYVDSNGGEGTASIAFSYNVPRGSLLVVESPSLEVPSALSATYGYWNVYISLDGAGGPFFLQNSAPINVGTPWMMPAGGFVSTVGPAEFLSLGNFNVEVTTGGLLQTTASVLSPIPIYLADSSSQCWMVVVNDMGQFVSSPISPTAVSPILISDTSAIAWRIGINTSGELTTTDVGPSSGYGFQSPSPPSDPTIIPMQGYVIGFRYVEQRIPITEPTQNLQVPDAYFDVVVAGVNYYANLYMAKGDDENFKVPVWKKEFMDGLAQIRRDLRINYRNSDFISPDRTTQQDQFRTIYGYYF